MAKEGKISSADLDLLLITDDPDEVVDHMRSRYRTYLDSVP